VFAGLNVLQAIENQFLAGNSAIGCIAEAHTKKHGIEIFLKIAGRRSHTGLLAGFHARPQASDHLHFGQGNVNRFAQHNNAVSRQPPAKFALLVHRDAVTELKELASAREARRPGSDYRHFFPRAFPGPKRIKPLAVRVVHRVALQAPDGDRFVFRTQHASALAQFLHRAHSGASGAKKIGIENRARGAEQVIGGNFLNEPRNVDVRGASVSTRRVVAHQATGRFRQGLLTREGRKQLAKPTGGCGTFKTVAQKALRRNLIHTTQGYKISGFAHSFENGKGLFARKAITPFPRVSLRPQVRSCT
jgi:hypothetical protein